MTDSTENLPAPAHESESSQSLTPEGARPDNMIIAEHLTPMIASIGIETNVHPITTEADLAVIIGIILTALARGRVHEAHIREAAARDLKRAASHSR